MLLAMASALSPDVAREAAETAIVNIGDVASFRSYEDAAKQISNYTISVMPLKAATNVSPSRPFARKRLWEILASVCIPMMNVTNI